MQLVFSWAPKLARKCESKHWFPCGADGQSAAVGVRSGDYQIFWDGFDLLSYGAPPTHGAWSSAITKLRMATSINLVGPCRFT